MANKNDLQELQVGGGQTGVSKTAEPTGVRATLPASHLDNGEKSPNKIANVTPGQYECETDEENNTKAEGDKAGYNKASIAGSSVKEDMDAMFNGESLSEEFKEKAATIFEAAVNARVDAISSQLFEQQEALVEARVLELAEQLSVNLDSYMSYVVEQWMERNEVAIESSLRTEVTEGFINGLKNLFAENYFDIPEDKVDVTEELAAKVEELEARLNESIEQNIALSNVVLESRKEKLFNDISEGLAATQVEKLRALSEGIEYSDAETFARKLQLIKESYFEGSKKAGIVPAVLNEEIVSVDDNGDVKSVNPAVAKYVSAISRNIKK